jgi:hypothetical protein
LVPSQISQFELETNADGADRNASTLKWGPPPPYAPGINAGNAGKSSLGDAKSPLSDVKSSLGDTKSSLGDAKSSLGDATSSLGGAESSLGGAESSLGDAKSSRWVTLRALAGCLE